MTAALSGEVSEAEASKPETATRIEARVPWWRTVRRLLPYQNQYWPIFVVAVMLLAANLVFDVGMALVQQTFFAEMRPGHLHQLLQLIWVCAVIGIGLTVLNGVQHFCRYYASAYADRAFALRLFTRVIRAPFAILHNFHSADLVSRIVNDTGLANNLISSLVYDVSYQIVLGVVAFYYLARINMVAAVASMLVGPVLFGLGRFFDARIRRISEQIQAHDAAIRASVQESIQELAAVRAYGLEEKTVHEFFVSKTLQNRLVVRRTVLQSAMWQLLMVAQGTVQVLSAVLVAKSALVGNLSPGQVMTFVFLMSNVQTPFMRMSQVWNSIQQSLGAADRVAKLEQLPLEDAGNSNNLAPRQGSVTLPPTDEPRKGRAEEGSSPWAADDCPAVAIDAIRFTPGAGDFASNGHSPLFDGLTLAVNPGETVALVGASGSGKTSLARLICGLYEPDTGDVQIFGHSTRHDLTRARAKLSYVPQAPYLFSGTIRENIALGMPDATDEEIENAARIASAHTFIMDLEKGYDTVIGEQGYRLSGGQRQRIAIARAFLRRAPLVVLDEPTSALDNETERAIQSALDEMMHRRTMIIIAHRLSTIRNADKIVVLNDGCVVEQGTHTELMRRRGLYANLVELQTT